MSKTTMCIFYYIYNPVGASPMTQIVSTLFILAGNRLHS